MNKKLVEKIEWLSNSIHLILVKISSATTIISPLLITFVNYFIYGMGDESFRFDGALWFPFDPNKPAGFLVALIFQCLAMFAVFSCVTPIVSIYIGSCWSVEIFLKEIAGDISHLKKKKILNLNEQKLTKRFCNFIRFHSDVEELSGIFSCNAIKCDCNQTIHHFRLIGQFDDIYEFIIFAIFLWGLATVASSLTVFQSVELSCE